MTSSPHREEKLDLGDGVITAGGWHANGKPSRSWGLSLCRTFFNVFLPGSISCIPGWLQMPFEAEAGLELPALLPLSPHCWNSRAWIQKSLGMECFLQAREMLNHLSHILRLGNGFELESTGLTACGIRCLPPNVGE